MDLDSSIPMDTGNDSEEGHTVESIEYDRVDDDMPPLRRQRVVVHEYSVDYKDPVIEETSSLCLQGGAPKHRHLVDVEPFPPYEGAAGCEQNLLAKFSKPPTPRQAGNENAYKVSKYDGARSLEDPFEDLDRLSSNSLDWSSGDNPLAIEDEDNEQDGVWQEEDEEGRNPAPHPATPISRGENERGSLDQPPEGPKPYRSTKAHCKRLRDKAGQVWEYFCLVERADGSVRRKYKKIKRITPEKDRDKSTTPDTEEPYLTIENHDEFHSRSKPQEGRSLSAWKCVQERYWRQRALSFGKAEAEKIRERCKAPPALEESEIKDEEDIIHSRSEPKEGMSPEAWEIVQERYWRKRSIGLGELEAQRVREEHEAREPRVSQAKMY